MYWGTILFIIICVGYGITQIGMIKEKLTQNTKRILKYKNR